jgi:hypothetical protein
VGDLQYDVHDLVNLPLLNKLLLQNDRYIEHLKQCAIEVRRNIDRAESRGRKIEEIQRIAHDLLQSASAVDEPRPEPAAVQAAVAQAEALLEDREYDPIVIPPDNTAAAIADELFGSSPLEMRATKVSATRQAQDLLEEVGRPMSVKELYQALKTRGSLHGKDPYEALRTSLRNRTDLFIRTGHGVYELRAKPSEVSPNGF